ASPSNDSDYRWHCTEPEGQLFKLGTEKNELRERFFAFKATVTAVLTRGIDAKSNTERKRYRKSGSRNRPEVSSTLLR
ncbi:MAG: hypothetical protein QXW39_09710, partial [Candidatus Bathyarchaeia archaeon]